MNRRRPILALALALAGALPMPPASAQTPAPLTEVIGRLGDEFIQPRFDMLALAASRLDESTGEACAAPGPEAIAEVQSRYAAAADLWSRVEFIRQGPLESDNAYERLAFWPDRRNAMTRAIAQLLAGSGDEGLAPDALREQSAAVQGLTALERLIYTESTWVKGSRACAVTHAIARRLALTTTAVAEGWTTEIAGARADPVLAREAVSRFVTDMLAQYHFIVDTKLRKPLGRDTGIGRPEQFEGYKSGRTVRALQMNVAGIEEAIHAMADEQMPAVRRVLAELVDARITLEDVPDLTADNDGADLRLRADRLIAAIRRVQVTSYDELPDALGITLGFNALDGD